MSNQNSSHTPTVEKLIEKGARTVVNAPPTPPPPPTGPSGTVNTPSTSQGESTR